MSNEPPPSDELISRTADHWNRNDTRWYIQNLLPWEMEYAQQQVEACDTLVLLIGFSPEPLLQTIWKYRPQRIVLVLNSMYGKQRGGRRADEYIEWVRLMAKQGHCPASALDRFEAASTKGQDVAIPEAEAQPDWVFRELRDRLLEDQRDGKRIVVDITGAKKNMAAGAFLFAAYAGADISYVDFEEYHPDKRRPLGYTCRIGTQPNPYRILGLRDWERVQKLYEQFAFDSAATEVSQLSENMDAGFPSTTGTGKYFSDAQRQAVTQLERVLDVLNQWDNGDFTASWQQWCATGQDGALSLQELMPTFPLPHAIQYLGSRAWPSARETDVNAFLQQHRNLKRGKVQPEDSVFNQPDVLFTYAFDELDKIDRLIRRQNDYRSAFLRSAGLDELLLKARVAILWLTDQLLIGGNSRAALLDEKAGFDKIADFPGADGLRNFLRDATGILEVRMRGGFTVKRKDGEPSTMCSYWERPDCTIDHETLVRLRGEAIHTHLSIPKTYAQAAYRIADYALKDFVKNWVTLLKKPYPDFRTWQLSWGDLCTHCKLDFLPTLPTEKE